MPAADTVRLSLDVTAVPAAAVGAGQYTLQLAGALASRPDVDLVLFGRRHDVRHWPVLAPGRGSWGGPPVPVRSDWPGSRPSYPACWPTRVWPSITDRTTPCPNDRTCLPW